MFQAKAFSRVSFAKPTLCKYIIEMECGNAADLSIIMIVRNEALHLPKCLTSIEGLADEIIIVDTGSTDNTKQIAQSFGAQVFEEPWQDDFAKARNHSISKAKGRFLLWLDADDLVPKSSHPAIRELVAKKESAAYTCIIDNLYEGRSGQSFRQIRLFPNQANLVFEGRIHESLSSGIKRAGLPLLSSNIRITHTGYDKASDREVKTRRNYALLQTEYASTPTDPAVLMELGNTCFQLKEYALALNWYQKLDKIPSLREKQKDIFDSLPTLIGMVFFETNQLNEAKNWFNLGVDRAPLATAPYYYLGQIALKENNPEILLTMCEKIISLSPVISTVASDITGMRANAFAFAGNLNFVRGHFEKALTLFDAADLEGLPAAYQYETAIEAAQKCNRPDRVVYYRNKISLKHN